MTLQRARVSTAVDLLAYYSQNFTIKTEWDGRRMYTISVYDEKDKKVLEVVEMRAELRDVESTFEELKTKYILK